MTQGTVSYGQAKSKAMDPMKVISLSLFVCMQEMADFFKYAFSLTVLGVSVTESQKIQLSKNVQRLSYKRSRLA